MKVQKLKVERVGPMRWDVKVVYVDGEHRWLSNIHDQNLIDLLDDMKREL